MARQLVARLGIFLLSLAAASFAIFVITQALPGDVAAVILGHGATPEQLAAKRAELGTDRPFGVQYLEWVGGLLTGDLGRSWFSSLPISTLIAPRLEVTGSLVVGGLALAVLIALPLGPWPRSSGAASPACSPRRPPRSAWPSRPSGPASCWSSCSASCCAGCRPTATSPSGATRAAGRPTSCCPWSRWG